MTDIDRPTCVVASSRPWNANMAVNLAERTGCIFEFIADAGGLTIDRLSAVNPQYVFFPHWSHRIGRDIFERFECIIFHMTDLPFGRGGSPLQNLIARGIYHTKISAIRCVEDVDSGPVYMKQPLSLDGSAEEIYTRASHLIEDMIVEILRQRPIPKPQIGEPTFFKRRRPEQSNLMSARSLEQVYDHIRMLDAAGYPRAFLEVGPIRIVFSHALKQANHVAAAVRIELIEQNDEREKQS